MIVTARQLVTAPTSEPLTVDGPTGVYTHSRITNDGERDLIEALITTARQWLEFETGRAFLSQTWDFYVHDFWNGCVLELPFPPLQSITSVKYTDEDGDEQTVTATVYEVDTASTPATLYLADGQSWPSDVKVKRNAVVIRTVCGHEEVDDVPATAIHALRLMVADMYEHRETTVMASLSRVPTLDRLIASLEVPEAA